MTLNMDIIKKDEKMAGAAYAHYCVSRGYAKINVTVDVEEMIDSDRHYLGLVLDGVVVDDARAYWQGYNEFMSNPSI